MAVDPYNMYSELTKDIYDDFELKKTLYSPWFKQQYLNVARVNPLLYPIRVFIWIALGRIQNLVRL